MLTEQSVSSRCLGLTDRGEEYEMYQSAWLCASKNRSARFLHEEGIRNGRACLS